MHNAPLYPANRPQGAGKVHVMPGVTATISGARPLTGEEEARAKRTAQRLHADLARLIDALPERARAGASAMARHLGIVRNTCQRTLSALQDERPSLDTLAKLPGVKGLEQLLGAIEERGGEREALDLARAAVRAFDDLIRAYAGSHTKLIARLSAAPERAHDDALAHERARARLVEAASAVTGRGVALSINVSIFWTSPAQGEHDQTLHRLSIVGLIGNTITPGGMPVVLTAGDTLDWCRPEDRSESFLEDAPLRGATPQALLAPFTSEPLPAVTTRGEANNLTQVIDPAQLDAPETFDIVTARRSGHPVMDDSGGHTLSEVWVLNNAPAQHLLFDVYLHREMERTYRPAIDALLWNPNLSIPGGDRWIARFPSQPRLELLGPGLDRADTACYPRQRELLDFTLRRAGLDPSQFVGFRCELTYPIWRAGYLMSFEPTA